MAPPFALLFSNDTQTQKHASPLAGMQLTESVIEPAQAIITLRNLKETKKEGRLNPQTTKGRRQRGVG